MAKTNIRGAQIADGAAGVDLTVDVTGTLPVANGGTGVATLGSGNVVVGAGTSAVTSSKAAPSGAFVGDTDAQTLTNKTLTSPIANAIYDTNAHLLLYLQPITNAVNYFEVDNAATGGDPAMYGWGTDTNVSLNLGTKGTGVVKANGVEVATVSGTQPLTGKTLSDTFLGEVFDAQKTQRDTTLLASNDFSVLDVLELGSATSLEIPSTSSLEIITYPPRRSVGRSVTPGASITINTDLYEQYLLSSLGAAITVTLTGTGRKILVGFRDDGTARAITWANAGSSGAATLLSTTVIGKTHWVGLIFDGAAWTCLAVDATGY